MLPHIHRFGFVFIAMLLSTVHAMPTPIPADSASGHKSSPPNSAHPPGPKPNPRTHSDDQTFKWPTPYRATVLDVVTLTYSQELDSHVGPAGYVLDLKKLPSVVINEKEKKQITSSITSALKLSKENKNRQRAFWVRYTNHVVYTDKTATDSTTTDKTATDKTATNKAHTKNKYATADMVMHIFVLERTDEVFDLLERPAEAADCNEHPCVGWRAALGTASFLTIYQLDPKIQKEGYADLKPFTKWPEAHSPLPARKAAIECDAIFRRVLSRKTFEDLKQWAPLKVEIDTRFELVLKEADKRKLYLTKESTDKRKKKGKATGSPPDGSTKKKARLSTQGSALASSPLEVSSQDIPAGSALPSGHEHPLPSGREPSLPFGHEHPLPSSHEPSLPLGHEHSLPSGRDSEASLPSGHEPLNPADKPIGRIPLPDPAVVPVYKWQTPYRITTFRIVTLTYSNVHGREAPADALLKLDLTELPPVKVGKSERSQITISTTTVLGLPKNPPDGKDSIRYTDAGYPNEASTEATNEAGTEATDEAGTEATNEAGTEANTDKAGIGRPRERIRFSPVKMFVFALDGKVSAGASHCSEWPCLGWRGKLGKYTFIKIYQLDPTKDKSSFEPFEKKLPDTATKGAKEAAAKCDEVFWTMLAREKFEDLPELWPALRRKIDIRDAQVIRDANIRENKAAKDRREGKKAQGSSITSRGKEEDEGVGITTR